ncbi:MAG: tetratricopeptide repeat protein, partial [Cytophagales bacterium]|nr:tetratricopeptide repeat protein [Cytophaga sp.]
MNFFLRSITLLFLFIVFIPVSFADVDANEGAFKKIETYYEKGDYKLGLRANKTLISKIESDKNSSALVIARSYFLYAKGSELDGDFQDYEGYMAKGNAVLKKAPMDDTYQYAKCISYAIETYISYGDFKNATTYLGDAYDIIQKSGLKDSNLYFDLKTSSVITYYKQGFAIKAQKAIPEIIRYRYRKIVKSEQVIDPKTGKTKSVAISGYNLVLRKRAYADILNLQADLYLDSGNYTATDSVLKAANEWIKKNIGTKDVSYVQNLFLQGKLNETLGNMSAANKLYDKAYDGLLKTKYGRYKNYSREAIEIFEYLIPTYKQTNQSKEFNKRANMLEVRVKRYYGNDNYYYSKVLLMDAEEQALLGDWDDVVKDVNKVLMKPGMVPDIHLDRAELLMFLSLAYVELDQYDEAEAAIDKATAIKLALLGEDAPNYHMQLLDRANYYVLYTDKFKQAEDAYAYSLDKIVSKEIDHKHKKYMTYLYQEAKMYELTDRFDQASKIIGQASLIIEKQYGKENTKYATALQKQANIDIYKGNFLEADMELQTALELFKRFATDKDNLDYANVLETQARLYIIEGLYEDAEKDLKKAYKLSRKSLKASKMSSSIEELAILYIHIGRYTETEKSLIASIELREKRFGVDNRSLINPLNQIGYLYYIKGDYSKAEKYSNRAMAISLKIFGNGSIRYAESLKLYADIHTAIGDYNKAQSTMMQVIAIYKKQYGEDHIQVAMATNELALIKYYNKGDKKEVEQLFLKSLTLIKSSLGDSNPIYADVLKNVSLFYLETDRVDMADQYLETANKIWIVKFGTSDRHAADYNYLKGIVNYKKGKYAEANTSFLKSKTIYETSFSTKHPDYTKALCKSGQMYFILKDYDNAVKSYDEAISSYLAFIKDQFPSLSEREKMKAWSTIKTDFEFYYSMAYQLKVQRPELMGNVYNMTMSTKALMLNSSIKVRQRILNSGNESLITAYQEWQGKKEYLSTVISMSDEQIKASGLNQVELEKQIEDLEKYLSESSEVFAQSYETKYTYDWKQLKGILNQNEASIEMIRFRYFSTKFTDTVVYGALVLYKDMKSYPEMISMNNGKEMEAKYIRYYRNCMKLHTEDKFSYDIFWKKIQAALPSDKTRLFIGPEGVYNQINLETLKGADGKFQLEKYQFVQVANTKDVLAESYKKQKPPAKNTTVKATVSNIALFGNPTYYPSISDTIIDYEKRIHQLPGAEAEVKNIYTYLKNNNIVSDLYVEQIATEEKVKQLKSPKFFHIATHGYFMPDVKQTGFESELDNDVSQNPLYRSGLLMYNGGKLINDTENIEFNAEDGLLTAYEAMNLDFDNTEIVIMSACETGLGDVQLGEGVYGLQRAFIVAGSQNMIMSLFKVSDEVTADLLNQFY